MNDSWSFEYIDFIIKRGKYKYLNSNEENSYTKNFENINKIKINDLFQDKFSFKIRKTSQLMRILHIFYLHRAITGLPKGVKSQIILY